MNKPTVTSAEFQKQFGRYKEIAQREPVSITNHGRASLVLLSAQEYERLKRLDTREALYAWELTEEDIKALKNSQIPEDHAKFDDELKA